MLLCSLEFALLTDNLKAQGTCTMSKTSKQTQQLPHLIRSVLELLECGFVKHCFVLRNLYCLKRIESPRQLKNFEVMFEFACLQNVCLCHRFERVTWVVARELLRKFPQLKFSFGCMEVLVKLSTTTQSYVCCSRGSMHDLHGSSRMQPIVRFCVSCNCCM